MTYLFKYDNIFLNKIKEVKQMDIIFITIILASNLSCLYLLNKDLKLEKIILKIFKKSIDLFL